jgi:hypothetical protein
MRLPSEIPFASFLQYSPGGKSDVSKRSRAVCYAIKNDSVLTVTPSGGAPVRAIEYVVEAIVRNLPNYPLLQHVLNRDRILIPVPRRAPLPHKDALWPTRRICDALVQVGLGSSVMPALMRHTAVQKSSTASPGERPDPIDHMNTTRMDHNASFSQKQNVTLVDDVVTRGATFLGMYPHVEAEFPDREVSCFALVRTMSAQEITAIMAPVNGVLRNCRGRPSRIP